MFGEREAVQLTETYDREPVADFTHSELFAELAAELLPLISPEEHTAAEYAAALGCDPNTAKSLLDAKVKECRMASRQVRANGRKATAYREI